jgi:iron complex outermembrane receptor protein
MEDFKGRFANSLNNTFSELSIRANYGKLGSQDGLDPYAAVGITTTYNGNTSVDHQGNDKLKWEEATTKGVGLDYAIKGNRFSGTIDYFFTKRVNLLFYDYVPGGFSASSRYWTNLPGHVNNKGVEVSINAVPVKNSKLTWDISYNMSFLKNRMYDMNRIVNTGAVNGQGLSGAYAQIIQDGYPLFTWKMLDFQGYDKDGFAIYANGAKDAIFGSALPTFIAGLTNNFSFGKWSASIFFNTSRGFYVYNNTANALFLKGSLKTAHNVTNDAGASVENSINPGSVSTRFLEKGDFIRLSNALVSYNFDLKKSSRIKSLSATLSGQNLLLFTDYTGLDPEVNVDHQIDGVPSRGFDYAGYPKPRTISLGINVGF